MKKLIFILLLLVMFLSLMSVTLKSIEQSYILDTDALYRTFPSELVTEKEKNGEMIKRNWKGISLLDLLKNYDLTEYDLIMFSSADNYLVRLTKEEIIKHDPLIAFYLNDEKLEGNRLVIPDMPGMYWISDISNIELEKQVVLSQPHILYLAENYLAEIDLVNDPKPFIDVEGYYLPQLLQLLMPSLKGQYKLVGKDGVSHLLDYTDYLAQAVLIKGETGYTLQSPQMPGGMWIKNIAYIQKGDIAVIFRDQFIDCRAVKELAGWVELPENFNVDPSLTDKKISTELPFDQGDWDGVHKVNW